MFNEIINISDKKVTIRIEGKNVLDKDLLNTHVVFEDDNKKILGEIEVVTTNSVKVNFLGELKDNKFISGILSKPKLDSNVRLINNDEINLIVGSNNRESLLLGKTPIYNHANIYLSINEFFSNHLAIMGNSGSGKSCGVARLLQNVFSNSNYIPVKSNFIIFDSTGEYYNAFKDIKKYNSNYNYKFVSTNYSDESYEKLKLPLWLLSVDDLALLLNVNSHSQLPLIERMYKLVYIFTNKNFNAIEYKNHIIAKAIMTVLFSNETSSSKKNEIFSIINSCQTDQFNMDAIIQGVGYTRKFKDCFNIDSTGNFSESVLLTKYVTEFIRNELDNLEPNEKTYFTLIDLEKALNFTMISEGWLRNSNTYNDAVTIKVRLHSLTTGAYSKYFNCSGYVTLQQFISNLVKTTDGTGKCQIININLDDVDDTFAKTLTKIYSRIIFDFTKSLREKGSLPFNILLEEAHRYIQKDTDEFILGYNIFNRIAKEGRKYGTILTLISQRPVEISDTVIAQCSNFLIFKMNHPMDVDYIRKMVPNISDEIVEKQKVLQPGYCMAFGSAFKIPMIVYMEMPNPVPKSNNADVFNRWSI